MLHDNQEYEMKENKFRGKWANNGEFIYGSYLYDYIHDRHFILVYDVQGNIREVRVAPEFVGQYIGLKDKNKKEIYENDSIIFDNYPEITFKVYFRKECAQFCFKTKDGHIELPKFSNINMNKSEIVDEK